MQYNFPDDIIDYLRGLEDRVKLLEKLSRAGTTSIDNGALQVRQDGNVRVKVGQLDDGSYGLALYDNSGLALPLSQLAFGIQASRADASITPVRNSWTDDSPLSRVVTVTNRRMIVVLTAQIRAGSGGTGTPADSYYGYRALGAQVIAPDFGRALYSRYDATGMDNTVQASYWDVQDSIANGSYTVIPTMYAGSIGAPANDSTFSYRRLTVLPY
jgi:hypothetical protein